MIGSAQADKKSEMQYLTHNETPLPQKEDAKDNAEYRLDKFMDAGGIMSQHHTKSSSTQLQNTVSEAKSETGAIGKLWNHCGETSDSETGAIGKLWNHCGETSDSETGAIGKLWNHCGETSNSESGAIGKLWNHCGETSNSETGAIGKLWNHCGETSNSETGAI
ncbi:hypothetical protein PoB_001250500 [Plakobranchus ocellatus]|uniref:Uncharacterized protein n=1 Tax=Plakobranchus ocellatus TaxID=259542 RepID=A0AAV3YS76_9GAST|nr:hypothetical protein PoB_001250500 [Plakobranchus ocellatus]